MGTQRCRGRSVSGGEVELVLRMRPWRSDGRRPCGQADARQVALDRAGLGKGGDYFHVTATGGAHGNVYSKNSPEEVGPGQAMPALGGGGLRTPGNF